MKHRHWHHPSFCSADSIGRHDVSYYLMHHYDWIRPHQFNGGLSPAASYTKLNMVYGIS